MPSCPSSEAKNRAESSSSSSAEPRSPPARSSRFVSASAAGAPAASGLVDLAVPDDEVDATVRAQVDALAAGAPAALAETKRLLRSDTDLAGRFPALLELSARFFASAEGQEGIAAFREKRAARWVPAPG